EHVLMVEGAPMAVADAHRRLSAHAAAARTPDRVGGVAGVHPLGSAAAGAREAATQLAEVARQRRCLPGGRRIDDLMKFRKWIAPPIASSRVEPYAAVARRVVSVPNGDADGVALLGPPPGEQRVTDSDATGVVAHTRPLE